MVFQSYALFPNLTALENIEYGLKTKKYGKAEVKEKALSALELVDLLNVKINILLKCLVDNSSE